MNKVIVYIFGDRKAEHHTVVELNNKCMYFYTDGYCGDNADAIISFIEFLGNEVFVTEKSLNALTEFITPNNIEVL